MSIENLNVSNSYLSFKLENETFAVTVERVHEILEIPTVTKVPKSPDFMTGVINLRGNVLPVIDTRIKFGLAKTDFTVDSCIIVLYIMMENEQITIGALVDSVQEVLELSSEKILPSPALGSKYKAEFIQGMIKNDEHFIMVLNIDEVFSINELHQMKENTSETII